MPRYINGKRVQTINRNSHNTDSGFYGSTKYFQQYVLPGTSLVSKVPFYQMTQPGQYGGTRINDWFYNTYASDPWYVRAPITLSKPISKLKTGIKIYYSRVTGLPWYDTNPRLATTNMATIDPKDGLIWLPSGPSGSTGSRTFTPAGVATVSKTQLISGSDNVFVSITDYGRATSTISVQKVDDSHLNFFSGSSNGSKKVGGTSFETSWSDVRITLIIDKIEAY